MEYFQIEYAVEVIWNIVESDLGCRGFPFQDDVDRLALHD
jgi:hypothetical protein